jgi:hypothetical protein
MIPTSEAERKAQATQFLDALAGAPNARHTFFSRGPAGTREMHGTLDAKWAELCWLSSSGNDVYVLAQAGDGRGRKRVNIIRGRAAFQEDDGGGAGIALPLPPNIIVATSAGRCQRWWLTSTLDLEALEGVERRMVESYGSDPGAKDLARVLRLPGFPNRKPGRDGFVCRLEHCNGQRYAWEEILQAFPPIPRARHEATELETTPPTEGELERLAQALEHVPADERDLWVRVGHALKTGGDACRALWEGWSATSPKWQPEDADYRWSSFRPEATHWQAIYGLAAQHGWQQATPEDFDGESGTQTPRAVDDPPSAPGGRVTRDPGGGFTYALPARDRCRAEEYAEGGPAWRPVWLVDGYLPVEVCLAVGAGGAGKSTLMLWELIHLVLGRPLYGREVLRPLKALYVTHEDPRELIEYRMHLMMTALGLTYAERLHVWQSLHILDATRVYAPWITRDERGNLVPTRRPQDIVDAYGPLGIDIAVVDTAIRVGGGEENDNRATDLLIVVARQVQAGLGAALILIHHTGKGQAREEVIDQYSGRGGSALGDGARHVTVLVPHVDTNGKLWIPPAGVLAADVAHGRVLRKHVTKQSWGPRSAPVWLIREGWSWRWAQGLEIEEVEDAKAALAAERQRAQLERVLVYIRTAALEGRRGSYREWRESARLRQAVEATRREIEEVLQLALESGRLRRQIEPAEGGVGRPQGWLEVVEK